MLISHSHKFIFIHVPKTAGSSIRQALRPYEPKSLVAARGIGRRLQKAGLVAPESLLFNYKGLNSHATALEIREKVPALIFNSYFKFAFARNPWDLHVSLYHFMLQTAHHQHDLVKSLGGFEEYIALIVQGDNKNPQKKFFVDDQGKILVDFVGRFENLEEDFRQVCKKIGISCSLPHLNRSDHKHYRTYYNNTTRELIAGHFKEDIELLGQTF